jgi:hypothetical protein
MLALLGVERCAEPMEQPADRTSLQQYDVDDEVLARGVASISGVRGPAAGVFYSAAGVGGRLRGRTHREVTGL